MSRQRQIASAAAWTAATALLASTWWYARVIRPIDRAQLNIFNNDLYNEVVPRVRFAFNALRHGRIPLWNPYQLAGTPFFATQQHGILYPLNLPHLFLPIAPALSVVAVTHYVIAALATAALARDLGTSRMGAALAAIAYAAGGSMFSRLYLPPHLYAAAWLPLQLLLIRRICIHGLTMRRAFALSAVCALQFIGGYGQYCVFAGYMMLAYSAGAAVARGWRSGVRGLAGVFVAAVVAAGLSAVQLLPSLELMLVSPRHPGALAAVRMRGTPASEMLQVLLLQSPLPGMARELGSGLILLFLAIVGATAKRSIRDRWFLLAITALAFAAAPGDQWRVFSFFEALPGYDWFRDPGRVLVVASLALSLLAAAGLDRLAACRPAGLARAALRAFAVLLGLAAVLLYLDPHSAQLRLWSRFLWLVPALLVLTIFRGGRWVRAPLFLLAVLELALQFKNVVVVPYAQPNFLAPPAGAVHYIAEHQGLSRTLVTSAFHTLSRFFPEPPQKTGMAAGLYAVGDYENLYPKWYDYYLAALQHLRAIHIAWQGGVIGNARKIDPKLLDLLGCRFILASRWEPFAPPGDPRHPTLYAGDGVRVLENPGAYPRAFLVGQARSADSALDALRLLQQPDFNPRTTVAVEGWKGELGPPSADIGEAQILHYAPERVAIHVEARHPAFLLLTDTYYPGWRAQVDGRPTSIFRADGTFRAVLVDAGEHQIVFEFRPMSFEIGIWITAATFALLGFLAAMRFRGRSRWAARRRASLGD